MAITAARTHTVIRTLPPCIHTDMGTVTGVTMASDSMAVTVVATEATAGATADMVATAAAVELTAAAAFAGVAVDPTAAGADNYQARVY